MSIERKVFSHLKGCPYVCKAYAATQDDVNLYMMLEFCPGGELEFHRARQEFFKEKDVRTYFAMLTYALEQMHFKYHVVHRDLKPENILLSDKGPTCPNFLLPSRSPRPSLLPLSTFSSSLGFIRLIDLNIAYITSDSKCQIPNPNHTTVGTMPYIGSDPLLPSAPPHPS